MRSIAGLSIVIALAFSMWTAPVAGQGAKPTTKPAAAWKAPRTADGQPDLQGVWTNATITPLERPTALGDKTMLTEAEAAALEQQTAAQREQTERGRPGDVGNYNEFWFDRGSKVLSTRQTSMVVDPPDGRIPIRPEAEARRDYNLAHNADGVEHMSVWDRCITRGMPGGMIPAGYNNAYQIVQTPGYVMIHFEMIHEARIIPLGGKPPLPSSLQLWMGDARGRWEGETLVVETRNFSDKSWSATSGFSGRLRGIPQTSAARLVERFTRTSADTIQYEALVDDPGVFARPWKMTFPLTRDDEYRIYEYACHEGNHAIPNVLRGGRYRDSLAAGKKP